jgi:phage-related baseplate assembly protein
MTQYAAIDLSQLPAPTVVEAIDYEAILADIKADFVIRAPDYASVLDTPSEPIVKLLESAAYVAINLRQRVNDASRAVLLATATGADLDNIAALFGVERQIITAEDLDAEPSIAAVFEDDTRLRNRVQMSLEGFTTAGTVGAYKFHALATSALVKDTDISSPAPGQVLVSVLAFEASGIADQALLDAVDVALEAVRPLTDQVTVQSAAIVDYTVTATLAMFAGPDASVVLAAAEAAVTTYVTDHHRLGYDITLSGLYAALHQPGVQNVVITSPGADLAINVGQAAHCSLITVTEAA